MQKTVFVIGAGSSIDMTSARFPSGEQLLASIADVMAEPKPHRSRGEAAQYLLEVMTSKMGPNGVDSYIAAARRIARLGAVHNSIDQLISSIDAPDVTLVCKAAIAYFIGKQEASLKEWSNPDAAARLRDKWLMTFLRERLSRAKSSDDGLAILQQHAFVIFNYDRLVEHLIRTFLKHRFELPDSGAAEMVNSLEIEHPYGSLGRLQDAGGNDGFPIGYGRFDKEFHFRVDEMISSLRTFGEATNVEIVERIKSMTESASNLVFVGFGFGAENLELLLPSDNRRLARRIYATVTGIDGRRWASLEADILGKLRRSRSEGTRDLLGSVYAPGRINTAVSCAELLTKYSHEW